MFLYILFVHGLLIFHQEFLRKGGIAKLSINTGGEYTITTASVPARSGKGQDAKEIGHNLAREQPKFGHNLVRTSGTLLRMNDQNLVLWAIDENMDTNLQAFYKHFCIGCLKTQKQQLYFVKIKQFFF